MKFLLLFFLVTMIFSGNAEAQKISEFRPDNRTGVSSETGLLKSWPAEGPTLLWTNLDLPKGNSSVSFGNNSLYTTGIKDGNDILFALDMQGKILCPKG